MVGPCWCPGSLVLGRGEEMRGDAPAAVLPGHGSWQRLCAREWPRLPSSPQPGSAQKAASHLFVFVFTCRGGTFGFLSRFALFPCSGRLRLLLSCKP